jgi:hypothetical protein
MQSPVAPTPEAEDFTVGAHPLLRLQRAVASRWVHRMLQPHATDAATTEPVGAGTLLLGPGAATGLVRRACPARLATST